MMRTEWRRAAGSEVVLVVDDQGAVRKAVPADAAVLRAFLAQLGVAAEIESADGMALASTDPDQWGSLVMARTQMGEIIWVDPRLYWDGIYQWFRSRGVDYDS